MRRAALFLILPFFLQLLGLGDTPLGGGLCGEVFRVQDPAFALKTPGFWYGLLFMVLLALELGYGLSLLLLPLLEVRPGKGWVRAGRGGWVEREVWGHALPAATRHTIRLTRLSIR